jgi:hypothetical protein
MAMSYRPFFWMCLLLVFGAGLEASAQTGTTGVSPTLQTDAEKFLLDLDDHIRDVTAAGSLKVTLSVDTCEKPFTSPLLRTIDSPASRVLLAFVLATFGLVVSIMSFLSGMSKDGRYRRIMRTRFLSLELDDEIARRRKPPPSFPIRRVLYGFWTLAPISVWATLLALYFSDIFVWFPSWLAELMVTWCVSLMIVMFLIFVPQVAVLTTRE